MEHKTYKGVKALAVYDDCFIGAKGYSLYKFDFDGHLLCKVGDIADRKYSIFAKFRIASRFMRAEVNALYTLNDGVMLAVARKGIFRCEVGERVFRKSFAVPRGSRPLNLCITPKGDIFFGEYFANMNKKSVNIYSSKDGGKSWRVVYTFEEGNINHIHGLFWDKYTDRVWVVTGDRDNECIIGYTEDGFATFHEVFRGGQEYRTCNLFFYPDYIVFATDSQYIVNEIKCFDRETLAITPLQQVQGSVIKGVQCGDVAIVSTTVEPSDINVDRHSYIWYSENGKVWREIFRAEKDCLPAIFQFGSMEFPTYCTSCLKYVISKGRAVKDIDGCSILIKM